eukprot:5957626-Prorocentrum_lima.AAC.1
MDMIAHRGMRREGGRERKTHAKAKVQKKMPMRRSGALSRRAMITHQRGGIRVGETAVAIQPNEEMHLGGTKVPQKVQKLSLIHISEPTRLDVI